MTQVLCAPSIIGALTGASSSITNALLHGPRPKLGEFTPSYILHTRVFWTYLLGGGGLFTLQKRL
jgi:hypothetical protein